MCRGLSLKPLFGNAPSVVQARRITSASTGSLNISFTSTPTDGNLILVISVTAQGRTHSMSGSGWNSTVLPFTPSIVVFWKIASSDPNSYTITYDSASLPNAYLYEISNFRRRGRYLRIAGSNWQSAVSSLDISSVGVKIHKGGILIGAECSTTASATHDWTNSFADKMPASGGSVGSSARRSYSAFAAGQNSTVTVGGAYDIRSVLLKIM